jgi:hypothetical protein
MKTMISRSVRWFAVAVLAIALSALTGCFGRIDIDGNWAGVIITTYECEGTPSTIQIEIAEGTITITGGTWGYTDLTGTILPMDEDTPDGRFQVILDNEGAQYGAMFFDDEGEHAAFYVESGPYDEMSSYRHGYIAALQRGEIQTITYSEANLVGDWSGAAARVNATFDVIESSESSAAITNPDGLLLEGTDGDGSFSTDIPGIYLYPEYETFGIYLSDSVIWPDTEETLEAMYIMSYDKQYVAAAFLTSLCSTSVFTAMEEQKFALWARQVE